MNEHKSIKDSFVWVSPDKKKRRFGGDMPPRKPESRHPILWLAQKDNERYLVNNA